MNKYVLSLYLYFLSTPKITKDIGRLVTSPATAKSKSKSTILKSKSKSTSILSGQVQVRVQVLFKKAKSKSKSKSSRKNEPATIFVLYSIIFIAVID